MSGTDDWWGTWTYTQSTYIYVNYVTYSRLQRGVALSECRFSKYECV